MAFLSGVVYQVDPVCAEFLCQMQLRRAVLKEADGIGFLNIGVGRVVYLKGFEGPVIQKQGRSLGHFLLGIPVIFVIDSLIVVNMDLMYRQRSGAVHHGIEKINILQFRTVQCDVQPAEIVKFIQLPGSFVFPVRNVV